MQHAVLEQLAKGNMYSEIALEMELSPSTVRTHINGCIVKLGVRDRGQAVIKAYKEGWI